MLGYLCIMYEMYAANVDFFFCILQVCIKNIKCRVLNSMKQFPYFIEYKNKDKVQKLNLINKYTSNVFFPEN